METIMGPAAEPSLNPNPLNPPIGGLFNIKNTCFMNCILQTLLAAKPQYFKLHLHDGQNCRKFERQHYCLECALVELNNANKSSSISPTRIYSTWHANMDEDFFLQVGKQQNHLSFLRALMIKIHDNRHTIANISGVSSTQCNCPGCALFLGQNRLHLKCTVCETDFYQLEHFMWLSLELGQSLGDCFKSFYEEKSSGFVCSKCNSPCVDRRELKRLPHIFVLDFKQPAFTTEKKKIAFTESHQIKDPETGRMVNYTLFSVIIGLRESISSGHCISYVNMNNSWFKCDDQNIELVDKNDVFDLRCQTLFYASDDYDGLSEGKENLSQLTVRTESTGDTSSSMDCGGPSSLSIRSNVDDIAGAPIGEQINEVALERRLLLAEKTSQSLELSLLQTGRSKVIEDYMVLENEEPSTNPKDMQQRSLKRKKIGSDAREQPHLTTQLLDRDDDKANIAEMPKSEYTVEDGIKALNAMDGLGDLRNFASFIISGDTKRNLFINLDPVERLPWLKAEFEATKKQSIDDDAKKTKVENEDWLLPSPKMLNGELGEEDSTKKQLRLKKQELASLAQTADDVLSNNSSSVQATLDNASKIICDRAKIIISIQGKDEVDQFRFFMDEKFERLFKVYADKVKLDPQSLVFCFRGEKISPTTTPDALGMDDDDIIKAHMKNK